MDRLLIQSSSPSSSSCSSVFSLVGEVPSSFPFNHRFRHTRAAFVPFRPHHNRHQHVDLNANVKKSLPLPVVSSFGGHRQGRINLLDGACSSTNPNSNRSRHDHFVKEKSADTKPLGAQDRGACSRKWASSAGAVVILWALIVFTIQPTLAALAFGGPNSVAKTGNSAAIAVGGKAELLSSAWTGFVAGCLHTLSGPDHLAALAPLSIGRSRIESAVVGALWGCGHDAGQVIFGILFLLLKDKLHIEVIRTWGTRVVGMTLLVIGAMGIKEASEIPTPCVALDGGECEVDALESTKNLVGAKRKVGFATFATGIVHGLQPDALMMILPALALPSRLAGAAFLCMFLFGTVLAMGSYTVFIGSCSEALKTRIPRITEKLTWVSSLIAITLGLAILFSQLFGFSLF